MTLKSNRLIPKARNAEWSASWAIPSHDAGRIKRPMTQTVPTTAVTVRIGEHAHDDGHCHRNERQHEVVLGEVCRLGRNRSVTRSWS